MRTARKRGAARHATEHHLLLGIAPDADLETVKRAYRHLAREVHPDTNPDDPTAAERFQKLTVAYETIAAHAPPAPPDPEPGPDADPTHPTTDPAPPPAGPDPAGPPADGTMPGPAARPRHNIFAATTPPPRGQESQATAPPDDGPAVAGPGDGIGRDGPASPEGPRPGPLPGASGTPRPRPVELPDRLADAVVRVLLLAPVLWVVAGLPGLAGRELTVGPPQVAIGTVVALVGWVLTGALLWSRAPSIPRRLRWWRSPGWDGTALIVRLVLFQAMAAGTTAAFLTAHVDDNDATDAPSWTIALWVMLIMAAWVLSGRVPASMGYQSRFERYWRLVDNGLPREIFRVRTPGAGRPPASPPLQR